MSSYEKVTPTNQQKSINQTPITIFNRNIRNKVG